jgi:hypothetical protein
VKRAAIGGRRAPLSVEGGKSREARPVGGGARVSSSGDSEEWRRMRSSWWGREGGLEERDNGGWKRVK